MVLLKFEPPKELVHLRVKIARDVHERVERYREFCGALETRRSRRAGARLRDGQRRRFSSARKGGREHPGQERAPASRKEGTPRR